jgi:branched-chain amino acid transport system ATP-binding protein
VTQTHAAESVREPQLDGELLGLKGVAIGYSGVPVVSGIDLTLRRGEVVALLGRNGAGKTTLIKTVAGLISPISGTLSIHGRRPPKSLHRRVRGGLGLVTEERAVIRRLSVIENLHLGSGQPDFAFSRFPELSPLKHKKVGLLSGGEQQMLALGRVLAARPNLLLIDELSLGLAPVIVERLLKEVRWAAEEAGTGVLLVEQQAATALRVADRAYVISAGEIKMSGEASELRKRWNEVENLYLTG